MFDFKNSIIQMTSVNSKLEFFMKQGHVPMKQRYNEQVKRLS